MDVTMDSPPIVTEQKDTNVATSSPPIPFVPHHFRDKSMYLVLDDDAVDFSRTQYFLQGRSSALTRKSLCSKRKNNY